jgi:hypothetical protein
LLDFALTGTSVTATGIPIVTPFSGIQLSVAAEFLLGRNSCHKNGARQDDNEYREE